MDMPAPSTARVPVVDTPMVLDADEIAVVAEIRQIRRTGRQAFFVLAVDNMSVTIRQCGGPRIVHHRGVRAARATGG